MPKVLIVDDADIPPQFDFLGDFLKQNGFGLFSAKDGQEAIERARLKQPDIILMDLLMPTMDGWEATKIIKKSKETQHIPIIALSATLYTAENQKKTLAAGCDDMQVRPVELPLLLEKMNRLLSRDP
ncbi:response regulator [Candidatus Albibeggiatoa sp. nov. NOAA]|uniref:response regulator n=1 Tax=Candidatus Albibeggiatoa sp. nov. NOAA TaxID=3162724 RepID=UPI0032F4381F|nr:response regulator [Thiotrichaceae bacterium]